MRHLWFALLVIALVIFAVAATVYGGVTDIGYPGPYRDVDGGCCM